MGNDKNNINIQNKKYLLLLENRLNEMNNMQIQLQNENQQLNNTINTLKNALNNKNELFENESIEEISNMINKLKDENHNLKIKNNKLINEQRITKTRLNDIEKYSLILKKSNINYKNKITEYETSNSWKLTKPLRKIKRN